MNEHLTERQLIDYQFKLASEARTDAARAHLDRCEACRHKLGELTRRFASLDLLREEITASETLVSKTVEKATMPAPMRRIVAWPRFAWLGATAAAVIVGFVLVLVSNSGRIHEPTRRGTDASRQTENARAVAKDEPYAGEPEKLVATGRGAKGGSVKAEGLGDGRVEGVPPSIRGPDARDTASHREAALDDATRTRKLSVIDEKPPFAPASAIELVVLPRRENVQLTIYNAADLTLVRERRNLTLKRGWNWLQFMWANTLIDPTSLALEPLEHKGEVEVQQLVFPPRLRELGRWLIRSEVAGQVPFELTYFTSGLSWRAFYMGTLSRDERTMHLEGYVRVSNNSGEDYEDAQTRLIVGRVHLLDEIAELAQRQYPYDAPVDRLGLTTGFERMDRNEEDSYMVRYDSQVAGQLMDSLERKEIRKEGLSEYFLYTIEGTETIPNEWGKRLLSFEADDIPVKGLYKYDEERWGGQTIRFLSFANDEDHKLGDTPIPDGTVRIYGRADEQGHLAYVGGTEVKYIPVGEEVELDLGPARLVEVEPVLMDYRTENYTYDNDGDINGWDEVRTWKVEVTNASMLPVDVEVTRGFETAYWTLKPQDAAVSYEKHDVTHARFKLSVPSRQKRVFEYEVTTYHGVREETLSNTREEK